MLKTRVYAALLALAGAATGWGQNVVVTPTDLHGWAPQLSGDGADVSFVNGPAGNPCGPDSLQLTVGANGDNGAQFRNTNYDGLSLASVSALSYAIYVAHDGSGGQAPYIVLNIDQDNNGTVDDLLFFEPVYQTGLYSGDPVPDQGVPVVGEWKTYDALVGGWWSFNANTFGPPLTTIASYLALYPDAVIRNSDTGAGGVRIVAGFGAGAWDNFIGNADCFTLGVGGESTTYDFSLGAPVFVDVNGDEPGTTTVVNTTLGDGDTIQDKVDAAAAAATNHGSYIRAISALAHARLSEGLVTQTQVSEMVTGAAKSQIGK